MVVECVTLETAHYFPENPIASQHRLRYRAIIERQSWDVPVIHQLEYDNYDNPSAVYLVWRDENSEVRGSTRLCPTDRPFMLKEVFSHMANMVEIPTGAEIMEGSRFCIDKDLPLETRKRVAVELVCGYLEYGLIFNVNKIVGVMYPIYWKNLFTDNGLDVTWLGNSVHTPDGKKSRAGYITVNEETYRNFIERTGLPKNGVINFGSQDALVKRDRYVA